MQQQGKNAQHDNLSQRRQKTRITSAQLAKQSSSLLLHREIAVEPTSPANEEASDVPAETENPEDAAKYSSRIKSIIQEYTSIVDIEEAATCVRELPAGACHVEFTEQAINLALEGKVIDRDHAVNLLVGLYERAALNATEIQAALMNVAEFLEDMRIDIPLVHQYSALLFGRLIAAGCFGLSWMISQPLAHLIECRLASLVFAEVLSVLEMETDLRSVTRMLADEEITAANVLPASVRDKDSEVQVFLHENGIEDFFADEDDDECDDDEDELDPEVAGKMRSTLEEYLSVKDLSELVLCINELEDTERRWMHFVHLSAVLSIDNKKSVRDEVSALLVQLVDSKHITPEDIEVAMESVLLEYEDLRVDIPKMGVNLSDLWTPLFQKQSLPFSWLRAAMNHLVASGYASEIVCALFAGFEARFGQAELQEWWSKQAEKDGFWNQLVDGEVVANETLIKWKQVLE